MWRFELCCQPGAGVRRRGDKVDIVEHNRVLGLEQGFQPRSQKGKVRISRREREKECLGVNACQIAQGSGLAIPARRMDQHMPLFKRGAQPHKKWDGWANWLGHCRMKILTRIFASRNRLMA